MQPAFYAIRPSIVRPKSLRPLDILNIAVIILSDSLLIYLTGHYSIIVYLVGSTLLGMGIHPVAGHFISGII